MVNIDAKPGGSTAKFEPIERVAAVAFVSLSVIVALFLLRDASMFVQTTTAQFFGHVGASAAITLTATGLAQVFASQRPWLVVVLLLGASGTVILEVAQLLNPSRSVELRDIAAGFSGVLVAGICSELVLRSVLRRTALKIHLAAAASAVLVLITVLAFNFNPGQAARVEHDASTCPVTEVAGNGERLIIGAGFADRCVLTGYGGLSRIGDEPARSVLVSADLPELQRAVARSLSVTLQAEVTTDAFEESPRRSGVIVQLEANERVVLQLAVRANRVEAITINEEQPLEVTSLYVQGLRPATTYELAATLTADQLTVWVDGELVGSARIDPTVYDKLQDGELRLLAGNNRSFLRPFPGTINWIEVETWSG